jgi:hypothetical protein
MTSGAAGFFSGAAVKRAPLCKYGIQVITQSHPPGRKIHVNIVCIWPEHHIKIWMIQFETLFAWNIASTDADAIPNARLTTPRLRGSGNA